MSYWVKQFGRTSDGVAPAWLEEQPERGRSQSFPANNRPGGIEVGDLLVLRPIGWQHFCAVAEVLTPAAWEPGPEEWRRRWPWRIEIQLQRAVDRIPDGPTLAELKVSPMSLRQHSHIRLSERQGRFAEKLLPPV